MHGNETKPDLNPHNIKNREIVKNNEATIGSMLKYFNHHVPYFCWSYRWSSDVVLVRRHNEITAS